MMVIISGRKCSNITSQCMCVACISTHMKATRTHSLVLCTHGYMCEGSAATHVKVAHGSITTHVMHSVAHV